VHVSAICSDCWALYKMNIVFQYDQNGKKQLTTTGILRVSVIVDMKSTAIFSYNVTDAFKMSTSLVTLGVPGVADVTFDFGVAIDMNVNWNVIGLQVPELCLMEIFLSVLVLAGTTINST